MTNRVLIDNSVLLAQAVAHGCIFLIECRVFNTTTLDSVHVQQNIRFWHDASGVYATQMMGSGITGPHREWMIPREERVEASFPDEPDGITWLVSTTLMSLMSRLDPGKSYSAVFTTPNQHSTEVTAHQGKLSRSPT